MADDDIDRISEAFTEFCLSTKLSRSRVTEFDVRAYLRCIQLTAVKYDNVECDSIPLITGSIAEFSIEPMLPCFSDVDVMYHHSNQLAIPSGYTPPTQLPGEFGSHVEGYEIIENEFSGYVYLERCCLLSECVDEYNVVQCERLLATNGSSDADDSRHGPALVNEHYMLSFAVGTSAFGICRDDRTHSVDSVYCMRCLWWPPQAADWPTRHRSHGWPDSATINRVVSNGCDVVGVAHPLCRHDEWMRKLAKVNHAVYLTSAAAVFLSVANKTMQCLLTDEMLDVLATMCLQSTNVRRCLNARHSSVLSLSQAAILMKVIALSSCSTVQLIEIELAKAYLHRALRCKDSDSAFIYCLANVYLAVLYYCTEQYQIAIGHCALSQVKRIQDHSNCSSHVTQGELLPRIDEKVDCSLGLAVFYQYIRTAALNVEQDKRCVSVFNTELFAHYLHMKFLSVTTHFYLSQVSLADAKWRYQCCFCNSSKLFITDVIVFKFANCTRFLSKQLTMDDTGEIKSLIVYQLDLDTSKLVELLQQSAVEHLSICGDLVVCDLGFLGLGPVSFTWDFKALYMYRYHQYDRCLQLCMRNVCTQIVNRCFTYHLIVFIPEFVQWLDEDFVSLFGLTLLVKPRRTRLNNPVFFFIRQWVLSLYLMTRCQIKLRHSVTSLATTLDYVHFARSDIRMIDRVFKCMADSFARDLGADRLSCTHDWLVLNFVEQMILKYISVSHGR